MKFKNKYRIESNRLQGWNYGNNALYFVTICTKDRICHFGRIENSEMRFSKIGASADKCWLDIPGHFPFVILHAHVVMPNHIHGIIEIAKPNDGDITVNDGINVEAQNFAPLHYPIKSQLPYKNQFGPQSQNLASIIRGYKIGVTKYAKSINPDWSWQPNYHDHIIRNNESYYKISNYIRQNPTQWEKDTFNNNINNNDKR